MEKNNNLWENYKNACNAYLDEFCAKHDFHNVSESDWVGGVVGGIIDIADFFFAMEDIITDIEYNADKDEILKWYDYCLLCHDAKMTEMNYKNWLRGCPKHPENILKNRAKEEYDKSIASLGNTDVDEKIFGVPALMKLKADINRLIDEYKENYKHDTIR